MPVTVPRVPRVILNEESLEHCRRKWDERYGMSLDELEKTKGGEQAWEAAREPWGVMADILKRRGGPFVLGETGRWFA